MEYKVKWDEQEIRKFLLKKGYMEQMMCSAKWFDYMRVILHNEEHNYSWDFWGCDKFVQNTGEEIDFFDFKILF